MEDGGHAISTFGRLDVLLPSSGVLGVNGESGGESACTHRHTGEGLPAGSHGPEVRRLSGLDNLRGATAESMSIGELD